MSKDEEKVISEDGKAILEEANIMLKLLTDKIDALNKEVDKEVIDKKVDAEDTIKENPIAYVLGAFLGGIVTGFLIGNGRKIK